MSRVERAEKQETLAEIVAEMRHGLDKSWHEVDREWAHDLADRIEAAKAREVQHALDHATRHAEAVAAGNCRDCVLRDSNAAKLREALCEIVFLCMKVGLSIHGDVACGIIASKARAALATPARNCDNYDTKHEAKKAWFLEEVQPRLDGKRMDHEEIPFFDWLFEKATKGISSKGATDGSK